MEWSISSFKGKKKYQTRVLYPIKLSLKGKTETRTFSDRQKLGEFITNKSIIRNVKISF